MRTHIVTTIQVLILGAFALWIAPVAATAEVDDTPAGSPLATATRVATVASAVPKVRGNGRCEDVIFFDGVFFEPSLKSIFFVS